MPEPKAMSSEQLFAARDSAIQQGQALLQILEKENREASEEEQAQLDSWESEANDFSERGHRQAVVEAKKLSFTDLERAAQEIPEKYNPRPDDSVRPRITDDPKRGFRSAAHFYDAVFKASQPGAAIDQVLRFSAAAAGMSQSDGAGGGFAVPPEFSRTIWDGLRAMPNNLLGMTNNFTVTGESLTFPANAETSRATGSRYGGVRGYWIAEADTITTSVPKVRQIKLEPQELAVLVPVTDKLLRNAPALGQYVTDAATDEINVLVGDSIVNGDGHGKPAGLMTAPCKIQVNRTTALKFQQKDVANMWVRLHSRAMLNAVWLIDQSVLAEILQLFTAVTNVAGSENVGGFSATLYNPTPREGAPWGTLVGRPIIVTEYGKQLGTSGDVILVDLGAYLTGTRAGGVDQATSIHVYFATAQTAFRFMFAVDGQCALQSAITPLSAGNTVSTVIHLN